MQNEIQICGIGIEVQNNKSKIFDNSISKSHEYGVQLFGDDNQTRCMPLVWRNRIEQCAYDGIIVFGEQCEPDIRGNIIANNRRSGIKLMKNAIAHIGGTSKEDILEVPDLANFDRVSLTKETEVEKIMQENMQTQLPIPQMKLAAESVMTLEAIQTGSAQLNNKFFRNQLTMKYLKDYIDGTFRLKSFPNSNIIRFNYNQGILIVEGCYATIIANRIDANIKANIALGGERSGKSKIKYNMI